MNGSALPATRWKQAVRITWQALSQALAALGKLLTRVPPSRLVLWGACVVLLAVWWFEHQARLRQTMELEQLQKQTARAVSALEARAAAAIREANERNVQAIQALEAKRHKLEREASDLATRLHSLQERERAQAAQVAALPPSELARHVATQLAFRDSGPAEKEESRNSADAIQNPKSKIENPPVPSPQRPAPSPALVLSEPQLRNLATALIERDACREQKDVVEAQFANCHIQVDTNAAIIQQQVNSLAKLNLALSAQDEILARREAQQQTELKAARGSRLSRLARAVEWVAIGIVLGAVIR